MLIDESDDSPDAEMNGALRAHALANELGVLLVQHGLVDAMNALAVLILSVIQQVVPKDDGGMRVRAGIAEHFRHVAAHVDLTCPHIQVEALGPEGGSPPSNSTLH